MKVFRDHIETLAGWRRLTYVKANWIERIAINRGIREGRYNLLFAPDLPGPRKHGAQYIVKPNSQLVSRLAGKPVPRWIRFITKKEFNSIDFSAAILCVFTWQAYPIASLIGIQVFLIASIWLTSYVKKCDAHRNVIDISETRH